MLEENRQLKEEISKKNFDERFLEGNEMKVKYYTGLPCFAVLMGVWLRLNLPIQHVAHLFGLDRKTV